MNRLRPFLFALVALAAVGLTVSVVLGVWRGTQTASGTVNATTASPDLYLCEPEESGIGCGPDDSGADEIIFEGLEDLLPAASVWTTLRLRNIAITPVDVLSAVPTVTEVTDPGNDCDVTPSIQIGVMGKVPYTAFLFGSGGSAFNDNHVSGSVFFLSGIQIFPRALDDPAYDYRLDAGMGVHIAAGDYEDFAIQVFLAVTAPDACEENVWDIAINWEVVSVGH